MLNNTAKIKVARYSIFSEKNSNYIIIFPDIPFWIATTYQGLDFLKNIDGKKTVEEISRIVFKDFNEQIQNMVQEFMKPLIESQVIYTSKKPRKVTQLPKKPNKITFLQTMNCNLRCKHCSVADYESKDLPSMNIDQAKLALDRVGAIMDKGQKKLSFLGGEPLLGDKFIELIKYANELDFQIGLSTNGLLIDEHFAEISKKYNINVQVSLDGPNKESHEAIRGKNTYDRTINKIKLLKKYDVDTQTNMVYHSGNIHLIEDYINLCRSLGVKKIRMVPLMNLGRAVNNLKAVSVNRYLDEIIKLIYKDPSFMDDLDDTSFMGLVMATKFSHRMIACGAGVITVMISPTGDVYPCLNIFDEEHKICNLFDEDYIEQFEQSRVRDFFLNLRIDQLNEKCMNCDMKYYCGGRCRGETLRTQHDITAPYPECKEWKKAMEKIFWLVTEFPELGEEKYRKVIEKTGTYVDIC
ncbi:thioether cross-link-forming SCIFF peptide maturase [Vallitalea longa]|uniref:Thioether cross-link-forming SCIFF peptide maturase n=1 Tax=Vallitalea longa TaxID=2936439 RepID=A0A9W6DHJ2_9FIRM|nr:radical SAM protein [Vallitalea longa]GKX31518.1 thioether cross-link-forming SCIFF peptide maturase [Vallitalea longa]